MLNTFQLSLGIITCRPFKNITIILQIVDLGHLDAENLSKCKNVPLKPQLWISSNKARFFSTEKQFLET